MSASLSAPPPTADPTAGAMPMPGDDAGGAPDADDSVLVTICKNDDGSYTVYAGDEPDADSGDMSDDDAGAMGAAGAAPAPTTPQPQGQPADSVGAALKIAMDILNADKSSEGAPGNADDQLNAGFSADKSPTPAGAGVSPMAQKY